MLKNHRHPQGNPKVEKKVATGVAYGINLRTLEVQRVAHYKDGTLRMLGQGSAPLTHKVPTGKDPQTEIRAFYNWSDVLWLPPVPNLDSHEDVLKLNRKAEELRSRRGFKS